MSDGDALTSRRHRRPVSHHHQRSRRVIMWTSSAPSVPPRPLRSRKDRPVAAPSADMPPIPPRPARRVDRSLSPHRDSFAPSPLNESTLAGHGNGLLKTLHRPGGSATAAAPPWSAPPPPPGVELPSIGQEGNEYAAYDEKPMHDPASSMAPADAAAAAAPETRNLAKDLELHAPKPALPTSSAKARIATVTRTDSSQAMAAGIGHPSTDDRDPYARSLKTKSSFTSHGSSLSLERMGSAQSASDTAEHGIPEIGQRVPMYPDAGDVQAPSPAPYALAVAAVAGGPSSSAMGTWPGEGGQQHRPGRHHGRTRSGREYVHGPPGSYGLHGHGTPVHDRFEKAWYEKHPDALEREEHGEYGPGIGGGRGEWARSREELDRIVRETSSRGAGVGEPPSSSSLDFFFSLSLSLSPRID